MSEQPEDPILDALKIAFCYMPRAIEVNRYDYGDRVDKVLEDVRVVREALLSRGQDPDEVYGEMNPDSTPNSSY